MYLCISVSFYKKILFLYRIYDLHFYYILWIYVYLEVLRHLVLAKINK